MDIVNEKLEDIKASLQCVNELADIKRNPVVESVLMPIIKAFPVIGDMIDSAINMKIDDFQNEKEQLVRTGFISEYHEQIATDGGRPDTDNYGINMNGNFQRYEFDKSFLKFCDMVLKMGD